MKCEWCYVPFGPPAVREAVVVSVVRRISHLGFTHLTIGGGDPFQYRHLGSTLQLAKSLGFLVHVDTNGIALRDSEQTLAILRCNVDLLGLPLDGSCPEIHDEMRLSPGHFDKVALQLQWLSKFLRIKINTIVTAANLDDLPSLARLVTTLKPSRWSIYQYWPLGPAAKAQLTHSVSDVDFMNATEQVRLAFPHINTSIEITPRESRRDTYPIIHHDGEVFIHTPRPENKFLSLGSIFNDETFERILQLCNPDRPCAVARFENGSGRSVDAS